MQRSTARCVQECAESRARTNMRHMCWGAPHDGGSGGSGGPRGESTPRCRGLRLTHAEPSVQIVRLGRGSRAPGAEGIERAPSSVFAQGHYHAGNLIQYVPSRGLRQARLYRCVFAGKRETAAHRWWNPFTGRMAVSGSDGSSWLWYSPTTAHPLGASSVPGWAL
jgi:hypothetical protein